MLISASGSELARITDRIFASLLPAGRLSALAFSNGLIVKLFEFITQPLDKATFPHFAKLSAYQDFGELSRQLFHYIRLVAFLTLPAAAAVMVLNRTIVEVIFQRGAFDETSVQLTSRALLFYALGVPASSIANILNRTFFGLKDTWTPTKVSLLRIGIKVLLSWVLIRPLAHLGLALAEAVSQVMKATFLFLALPRAIKGREVGATLISFGRTLIGCVVMGGAVYFVKGGLDKIVGVYLEVAVLIFLGVAVYTLLGWLLQPEIVRSLLKSLKALKIKAASEAS